jgi:hypothetical protein
MNRLSNDVNNTKHANLISSLINAHSAVLQAIVEAEWDSIVVLGEEKNIPLLV